MHYLNNEIQSSEAVIFKMNTSSYNILISNISGVIESIIFIIVK